MKKDNIIKFKSHDKKQKNINKDLKDLEVSFVDLMKNLQEEFTIKKVLLEDGYKLLNKAIATDNAKNPYEIFSMDQEFIEIPLKSAFLNKDKFTISLVRETIKDEIKDATYMFYITDKPHKAHVIKKTVDKNGKTRYENFNKKEKKWEKTDDISLDILCGPAIKNNETGPNKNNGYGEISSLISFDNMIGLKVGLTKEQDEMIKTIGQVYDANMGVLRPMISKNKILLAPIDSKWNGFAIAVDKKSKLSACFYLVSKKSLDMKLEDSAYRVSEIIYPVIEDITVEESNELVKRLLKSRQGMSNAITIPISKDRVLIGTGNHVNEVLNSLKLNIENTTKEEDIVIEDIKKLMSKSKEEEIL